MHTDEFEGTEVLEKLATIDAVDAFFEAIDADDHRAAVRLMKRAGVEADAIAVVVQKLADADGEH